MYWHPRFLKNWDWWLTLFTLAIIGAGMVVLSSAATGFDPAAARGMMIKQGIAVIFGLSAWVVLGLLDYTELRSLHYPLYVINVLLLALVLVIGSVHNGSKSWIDLGGFSVQPSELSKVLLVITLSKHLDERERLTGWLDLTMPVLHVLPIMGLVLAQGDLGTALVIAAISIVMVYGAGFPGKKILLAGLLGAALVTGLVLSHYHRGTMFPLKEYQWQRIHVFLYPESDPTDRGWQVLQSKVAIGSGGMWGRGYGQGTQNKLGWLPYQHTDFIFAVVAEEFGFVGGVTLLALYSLIFFRVGHMAQLARDRYGALIATGVSALLAAHVLENIGMTLGVTPVTGIPLPFVSYGPTALLANLVALGLVQSIAIHRDTLTF